MVSPMGIAEVTAPRHERIARRLFLVVCLPLLAFSSADAGGQIPQDANTPPADQILASYEGQPVTTVDIAGRPDLNVSQFVSDLAQQSGQPFSKQNVDHTAAAIKAAGK